MKGALGRCSDSGHITNSRPHANATREKRCGEGRVKHFSSSSKTREAPGQGSCHSLTAGSGDGVAPCPRACACRSTTRRCRDSGTFCTCTCIRRLAPCRSHRSARPRAFRRTAPAAPAAFPCRRPPFPVVAAAQRQGGAGYGLRRRWWGALMIVGLHFFLTHVPITWMRVAGRGRYAYTEVRECLV